MRAIWKERRAESYDQEGVPQKVSIYEHEVTVVGYVSEARHIRAIVVQGGDIFPVDLDELRVPHE